MPPRLVEQWLTMYEVWPTQAGSFSQPASIHEVQAAPERKRNPEQRRWWVRHLRQDGQVSSEGWVEPYHFRRFYFASEVEAWEGLLEMERWRLAHFREKVAEVEREIGELEQMLRFKRWQAGAADEA